MKSAVLPVLREPRTGAPLQLDAFEIEGEEIESGVLRGSEAWYPIIEGLPRMLVGELRGDYRDFARRHGLDSTSGGAAPVCDESQGGQVKTNVTFSEKWTRFQNYGFEPQEQAFLNQWYVKKLGLESVDDLPRFYAAKRSILEIGPGSGFNTRYMTSHTEGEVYAVDVSEAAMTTHRNTRDLSNCHVMQADLMDLPLPDDHFDFAIADGVLHHTPDTRAAVEAVLHKVAPGGQFFFYVYRRMGAARAFCDQHLRERLSALDAETCFAQCEGMTELGRELSRLEARITLTRGIPALGIPPGEHDVQRLLYYNFIKCFWNEAFDWDTNNMVNFDWYHPHHAWQHSEDEVRGWLDALGVREYAFHHANPNGISVLLRKPS